MSTLETLKAARANIAQGWTKGTYRSHATMDADSKINYCAIGALENVQWNSEEDPSVLLLHDAVVALHSDHIRSVPGATTSGVVISYNDLPTTTQEDVLAVYDHAIRAAQGNWAKDFVAKLPELAVEETV